MRWAFLNRFAASSLVRLTWYFAAMPDIVSPERTTWTRVPVVVVVLAAGLATAGLGAAVARGAPGRAVTRSFCPG